jgi:subtilisin family serine protease
MVGVVLGAGQAVIWLASAWFLQKNAVYLAIEPFEVRHGDTANREEGKELAQAFAKRIRLIDNTLTADLSSLKSTEQFRIESAIPKTLALASDVNTKLDVELKAFDVDLVGIYERIHKFFDPSDYLKVSVYINGKVKLFASARSGNKGREIGPWWIADNADEQTAIDELSYRFMLVMLTYFATLCSLDNDIDQAEKTYTQILTISPSDTFALKELKRIQEAKQLSPFTVDRQKRNVETLRAELVANGLNGYDIKMVPSNKRDVVVAVLGTGISLALKDEINDRLVDAISVVPTETDTIDRQGHGTAVISLVAALAPHAKIMSIKCLNEIGQGGFEIIAQGIHAAISRNANVLVVPLGGSQLERSVQEAIDSAKAGILVVAAAGNDGEQRVTFPASMNGVLSVGATDHQDLVTDFSNYGRAVSLYAEGRDILVNGLHGERQTQSGTSFSAAIAAAIAAVTWSARPNYISEQIKKLLIDTTTDISGANAKKSGGAAVRRIDGLKAIAA